MENKTNEDTSFRDRLTTVSDKGDRVWVYAKKPKGKLYNYRKILAFFLLAFLFIAPFIKVHGEQFMLFNIIERKFVIFGVIFWPQDFHLFVLAMITMIVFVVLFTVIYGRLFCGWVCPQTIFMEFIFRQIEWLIDGNPQAQRKLKKQPLNAEKIFKRVLKHGIYYLISLFIAFIFLSYILGVEQVKEFIIAGPSANMGGFIGIFVFSFVFYFIFAWFREQVCTIACPYGRLQGVMLDNNSMVVAYDYLRGEPRGPLNKNENQGDCIACQACVVVCPTGVDIRNGTQLECINCTACIDACDAVMTRVKKPKGLIRFASEISIKEGKKHKLNTRAIAYSVVLAVLISLVAYLFSVRTDIETTILRAPGTLFQETEDSYTNLYNIEIVNKSREEIPISVKLIEGNGSIQMIGGELSAKKGELTKAMFIILIKKVNLHDSKNSVKIGIYNGDQLIEEIPSTFVGPNKLDKK